MCIMLGINFSAPMFSIQLIETDNQHTNSLSVVSGWKLVFLKPVGYQYKSSISTHSHFLGPNVM
jgi:hypothetical protein